MFPNQARNLEIANLGSLNKTVSPREAMMRYLFILILLSAFGCATKTIRVVDAEGKPVAGVLVLSQQLPYILQPWTIGAYETDEDGKAEVVSSSGYILKPGYFPVIDGNEVGNAFLWSRPSDFSSVTTIFPIVDNDLIKVEQSVYVTDVPISKNTFRVPVQICGLTKVEYNTEDSNITIQSDDQNIVPSERFFFVGASGVGEFSSLRQENDVSFYCQDKESLYKVGISVSSKVWRSGKPTHELSIFMAKVSSTNAYIQPSVKCISKMDVDNFSIGEYRQESPTVYASSGISSAIENIATTIPCANENSDLMFKYVKKYL